MRPVQFVSFLFAATGLTLSLAADTTQIRLPKLPRNVPREIPRLDRMPSLDDLLNRDPLTSSLEDAVTEIPFLDRFDPSHPSPLLELPFGFDDGVTLVPGAWEGTLQSYCLHAGTYGPTRGDGYLWAPLKGPKADVVKGILNRSALHPDVPQRDIQVLLWGIIARTKVSEMAEGPRRAAAQLLDNEQIASIDGSALDVLPDEWLRKITGPVQGPIRRALEAENRLRQLFADPGGAAYGELERVAVLNGVPPASERGRDVPGGRWSWHPQGFFIRFLPNSYTNMRLQIYSPERFVARRDNNGALAELRDVPGATLRIERSAGNAARLVFVTIDGKERVLTPRAGVNADEAAREATAVMQKIVPAAGKDTGGAGDVADVARLAALVEDDDATLFLQRALASAAGHWAGGATAVAALERARYQSASLGGLLAPPSDSGAARQRGGGWGGGGGGSGGGGGGGGMPGGGRQRLGPSLRKFGDDNSIDRARRAVDMFGKGNNALSAATDPASLFGMAIPDALFGRILDFNFDTWEKASGALAGDPPRGDFQEFSRPEVPDIPKIKPGGGVTPAQADRLNAIAADLLTANAHLQAAIVALDRHGGAVKAGDRAWAAKQARALTYLKREAGLLSVRVAEQLEALTKDAPESEPRTALITGLRELGSHFASLPSIGAPW